MAHPDYKKLSNIEHEFSDGTHMGRGKTAEEAMDAFKIAKHENRDCVSFYSVIHTYGNELDDNDEEDD